MTSERSKRRDFLSLIFIAKSISKKLLIKDIFLLTFVGIEAILLFKCKMVDKVQVKALKGFEEACVLKETIC